jgi:hypothetical protein
MPSEYTFQSTKYRVTKDKTYPALIAIASAIYDYAQNASGSDDTSYYGMLSPTDPAAVY